MNFTSLHDYEIRFLMIGLYYLLQIPTQYFVDLN